MAVLSRIRVVLSLERGSDVICDGDDNGRLMVDGTEERERE